MAQDDTPGVLGCNEGLGQDPARAAFEAWFSSDGRYPQAIERSGNGYKLMGTHNAWTAWEASWQSAQAAERGRPRQVLAYMATSREGTVRFTDNPDAARELEGYGWAITPLADAGPNMNSTAHPAA